MVPRRISAASPMRVRCSPIIEWLCANLPRHPKEYFHDQWTSYNISRGVLPHSGTGVGSRETQGPAVSGCHNSANSGGVYRIWCNGRRNAEVRRQVLSHNGRRFGRRWLWRFSPDSIRDCVWSGAPGRFRRCLFFRFAQDGRWAIREKGRSGFVTTKGSLCD